MPVDPHGLFLITPDLPAPLTLPRPHPHLTLEHVPLPVLHHPVLRPLHSHLLAQPVPSALHPRPRSLPIFDLEELSDHALPPGVCLQPMQAEGEHLPLSFLSQGLHRASPKLEGAKGEGEEMLPQQDVGYEEELPVAWDTRKAEVVKHEVRLPGGWVSC